MKYIQYAGYVTQLIDKLADVDTDLPIHEEHLASLKKRVVDGTYTYLRISDGTNIEFIKVENVGGSLRVQRGLELTEPHTFPVGSCVRWELTPTAIRDIICQMPCCEE